MKIQAVFFDMGGTIETYGYTHALRLEATAVIRQQLLQAGVALPWNAEQMLQVISDGWKRYKDWSIQTREELPPAQVWTEYIFADQRVDLGRVAEIAENLSFLFETRFYNRAMRPEMPAVLAALRQMGLKIGLISNVNSRGQVPTNLKQYGIQSFFDPIVLSSEYGRRKPDPAIFHHAARLANVPASACLYVGDRVQRDIEGARRAGFGKAILIEHDFAHGEDEGGAAPDAVIASMTGLLAILRAEPETDPMPAPHSPVRGLIFDAGDLLYYRHERGTKFKAFLSELGIELADNHAEMKKAIEYRAYRGQISQNAYREAIVALYGITDAAQMERGKQALVDDDANVTFFEGVAETLLRLKQMGYLLGIITDTANTISAKLSWFERGGFGHVWDSIISSMDLGVRKPDPGIYHASLRQLGLKPCEAIFVGHRNYELEGARAVGMATIAFNYDPDAQADCFIGRFSELTDVVGSRF